jgi:hypothetical protein
MWTNGNVFSELFKIKHYVKHSENHGFWVKAHHGDPLWTLLNLVSQYI